jgi:NAD(P)-dependent dehydrogenase (short-subunit alcohol dehydrogenase family)
LVTGAGRGIGLATARELVARGVRGVVLVDLPMRRFDVAGAVEIAQAEPRELRPIAP